MSQLLDASKEAAKSVVMKALLAWEKMESGVSYDPTSASLRENPYEKYKEIRSKDPIHRLRLVNAWLLTGYNEIDTVLRDHKRFTNSQRGFAFTELRTLLHTDPPKHTRLRALILKAFTPKAIAKLEDGIQSTVNQLLDLIADKKRIDVVADIAYPLPVIVIAEMLGVPPEDRDRFKVWSDDLALSVEPILVRTHVDRIKKSWDEIFEYFEGIIVKREADPQNDLISSLIEAEDDGSKLNREELLLTLLLLLVAGNETTRNMIGNGMLALLRHPDQMELLRSKPDLMESAVTEFLRYDSPVQLDGRYIMEDAEIGGKRVRAGQQLLCALGAANRDPEVYTDPDKLDITRNEAKHLSFGRGIHHCLGSSLAMLEGRIVFSALLERYSSMELACEPEFRDRVVLRGVKELLVDVVPRTG